MGGDHHHHPSIKVPDYRKFKVEDCETLQNVQRALAQKGLKDPWLRNHVWKYPSFCSANVQANLFSFVTFGMRTGFCFFAAGLAMEYTYKFFNPPPADHHGHGHH